MLKTESRPQLQLRLASLILASFFLAIGADAGSPTAASRNVKATLLAETESARPGTPLWLGVHLEMAPHWHTYWKNPGDSGLATRIKWSLPEGLAAGPIVWPYPSKIVFGPLVTYGYEGEVLLLTQVTLPPTLIAGQEVRVPARVDWLECQEQCIPGKANLELVLPVGAAEPKVSVAAAALFASARQRLPQPPSGWQLEAQANASLVRLTLQPPAGVNLSDASFFSDRPLVLDHAKPQKLAPASPRQSGGSVFQLDLPRAANAPAPDRLSGVLLAGGVPLQIDLPVEAGTFVVASSAAPPASAPVTTTLPLALAFSFLGGLILNLMPCVLPVLSLKVLGFVRHAGEHGAWRQGVAFTVGVLLSFWTLAGILLALRAGGEQVGWGFQLQSPAFVAVLTCLFLLMGLNLFGVFEVGGSLVAAGGLVQQKRGLAASFWNGALATLVATPCTAPFMGSALGFGLSQPVATTLLVFTALGLGMAAPYLVLACSPRLLRYVPRPGRWMETFKQLMGFFLMATVAGLLWLFGQQTGIDALARLLFGLVAVAMGAWVYGRAGDAGGRARSLASAVALLLVVGGVMLGMARADERPVAGRAVAEAGWEPFSPQRLAELRSQGKPVFIDFTAAWCLSCQVNQRVAIDTPEVQSRFRSAGVTLLKADWTLRDDAITQALAGYGRRGVPLYVLYSSDPAAGPQLLPEVLSPGIVLSALDEIH